VFSSLSCCRKKFASSSLAWPRIYVANLNHRRPHCMTARQRKNRRKYKPQVSQVPGVVALVAVLQQKSASPRSPLWFIFSIFVVIRRFQWSRVFIVSPLSSLSIYNRRFQKRLVFSPHSKHRIFQDRFRFDNNDNKEWIEMMESHNLVGKTAYTLASFITRNQLQKISTVFTWLATSTDVRSVQQKKTSNILQCHFCAFPDLSAAAWYSTCRKLSGKES